MIPWLAGVLRDGGVTVVEHPGWQTRAAPGGWTPTYGVVHATAAPATQSDDTQVRLVRDGHSTLAGPIANACVDRQGRWHVLAAGRCNTTITGTAGPYRGLGNASALGVEACNDNRAEPWPTVQYQSYVRGWAAICARLGWTAHNLVGHKEHTPGHKTDPTFDMAAFRVAVTTALHDGTPPTTGDDVTATEVWAQRFTGTREDGTPYDFSAGEFLVGANAAAHKALDEVRAQLYQRVPSAATADVPNRTVDQVLGDLWHAVHGRLQRMETTLAAMEAREVSRDAALLTLIQGLPGAGTGTELNDAQLVVLVAAVREAVAAAGVVTSNQMLTALTVETRDAIADGLEGGSAAVRADAD